MITISVKITKEDKDVMVKMFESVKDYRPIIDDLDAVITYYIYLDIQSKLRASQHNSKAIRLNIVSVCVFLKFIDNVYAKIGTYEMANALILSGQIRKEITKKVLTL